MTIDIGRLFSNAWEKFSANIGMAIVVYIVGVLIAGLLSAVTLGIAGIPVFAGVFKAMRRLQRGEAPDFSDLFSEFSNFGKWFSLWLLWLVAGAVLGLLSFITAGIGSILSIAVGFVLFFVIPLMLEQNLSAFEALKSSWNMLKSNIGTLFLPILLVLIVSGIFAPITGPLMAIAMWDIYDKAYQQ